jgi:hypothetical protein
MSSNTQITEALGGTFPPSEQQPTDSRWRSTPRVYTESLKSTGIAASTVKTAQRFARKSPGSLCLAFATNRRPDRYGDVDAEDESVRSLSVLD